MMAVPRAARPPDLAEALERHVEAWRWATGPYGAERRRIMGRSTVVLRRQVGGVEAWDAERQREWLEQGLASAETFYWHPDLLPLLVAGAGVPGETRLGRDQVPARCGFLWLGGPLKDPGYDLPPLRALHWNVLERRPVPGGELRRELAVTGWSPLGPASTSAESLAALRFPFGCQPVYAHWRLGESVHEATCDAAASGVTIFVGVEFLLRVFAAACLFLDQTLVVAGEGELVERHARRRVEREGWTSDPLVRVVRLRRVQHQPDVPLLGPARGGEPEASEAEACAVDWSCRWIVRGR
jgi:hypothetical protein